MKLFAISLLAATLTSLLTYYSVAGGKQGLEKSDQLRQCRQTNPISEQTLQSSPQQKKLLIQLSHSIAIKNKSSSTNIPNPCPVDQGLKLLENNQKYPEPTKTKNEQTNSDILFSLEYRDQELAINFEELPEEAKDLEEKRFKKLTETSDFFQNKYSRFKIHKGNPRGSHYYGIDTGEYLDSERFLGNRICTNPTFYFADSPLTYLGIFFNVLQDRKYGGRVDIINEDIATLIEASFHTDLFKKPPLHRYLPRSLYSMWAHKDLDRDYKGFLYELETIKETPAYQSRSGHIIDPMTSWLYNSCQQSLATVSDFCSLDPSYDMQYKDFFYLPNQDLMLGNIYCKKSHEINWSRIATFELIRVK